MFLIFVFSISIFCKEKPTISMDLLSYKLIQGENNSIISNSKHLLDYKNISGQMFFLSSQEFNERIEKVDYDHFLHISIMNLTFTLSIINQFYILASTLFNSSNSIDFCNAKLVDSSEFQVIIAFCNYNKAMKPVIKLNKLFLLF